MKKIKLEANQIKLVSENIRLAPNWKAKRMYSTNEYVSCFMFLHAEFRKSRDLQELGLQTFKKPKIKIEVWTYLDITNYEKMIVDILEKMGLFSNDRIVEDVHSIKHTIKKGHLCNVKVEIREDK